MHHVPCSHQARGTLLNTLRSVMIYSARRLFRGGAKGGKGGSVAESGKPGVPNSGLAQHLHGQEPALGDRSATARLAHASRAPLGSVIPLPHQIDSTEGSSEQKGPQGKRVLAPSPAPGLSQCTARTSQQKKVFRDGQWHSGLRDVLEVGFTDSLRRIYLAGAHVIGLWQTRVAASSRHSPS